MDFLFLQISIETYLWNSAEQKYRETGVSLPWFFLNDDGITTLWQAEKAGLYKGVSVVSMSPETQMGSAGLRHVMQKYDSTLADHASDSHNSSLN